MKYIIPLNSHNKDRGEFMKNMFKVAGAITALALVGGGVYLMNNKNARTNVGKKMVKAMDGAENMIAKKMN